MGDRCPSPKTFEAYVIGALADAVLTEVEAHVMACPACAARLQREAELEMAFEALVVETRNVRRLPRVSTLGASVVAGGALAMAAAMLLWLAPRGESSDARQPSAVEEPAPSAESAEINADASAATARLDLQADGSRLGVRD